MTLVIPDEIWVKVLELPLEQMGQYMIGLAQRTTTGGEFQPTGNAIVDGLLSQRKKRGGQLGNRNAQKTNKNESKTNKNESKTNKNESDTSIKNNIYNNNINNIDIYKKKESVEKKKETHTHSPAPQFSYPFLPGMMIEEKSRYFLADVKRFEDIFGAETCKEFYEYYAQPNWRKRTILMEEYEHWDTLIRLKRWTRSNKKQSSSM